MDPTIITGRQNPEKKIQDAIILFLEKRGWYVLVTHGNAYQSGLPDLYACHKVFGSRWIEVKNPKKYIFTRAQMLVFPKLSEHGKGVWVLTAGTKEEYAKLFQPSNWHNYLVF